LMDKLFAPQAFNSNNSTTLTDRLEVYFHDFSIMPMFVQENYLKHKFTKTSNLSGHDAALKNCELLTKAADSISDGDLVDSLIHGSQQQWSLLPVHGIFSTIRPAFYCHGMGSFGGAHGHNTRAFPAWFSRNSTQGKLQRFLGDIQIRMRLKVSGDRREIRQSYLPTLFTTLTQPFVNKSETAVEEVIEVMDQYFLTRDEFDGILELGLGDSDGEKVLKGVPATVKTNFTKQYNKGSHPIPFVSGAEISRAKTKIKGEAPDLEEAMVDDVDVSESEEEGSDEVNPESALKKQKGVKVKKVRSAQLNKANDTSKGKGGKKK